MASMARTVVMCVLLLALDPWPFTRLRPHRPTRAHGQQAPESESPPGSDSAVVVCDAISCEVDCHKRTKDCPVYGCSGVCIGYSCHCFSKPKPPPGGWKEYNPTGEAEEPPPADQGQAFQPVAVDPMQQQQQQQQQQAVQAHMQMQMQPQQHPMQLMQLQPL